MPSRDRPDGIGYARCHWSPVTFLPPRDAVKQILADTADKIGDGYDQQTKKSLEYGYGRVNAGAAVDVAKSM